jgi:hypothetical protein
MARLACEQIEYMPEQLIRVSPTADAPEITRLRRARVPDLPRRLANGIITVSHAQVTP